MLLEAFFVFYLLEILVLTIWFILYYREPKQKEKKIYNPWGFWDKEN